MKLLHNLYEPLSIKLRRDLHRVVFILLRARIIILSNKCHVKYLLDKLIVFYNFTHVCAYTCESADRRVLRLYVLYVFCAQLRHAVMMAIKAKVFCIHTDINQWSVNVLTLYNLMCALGYATRVDISLMRDKSALIGVSSQTWEKSD